MLTALFAWLLAALAVERITEIIVNGVIFERPRDWILRKNNFWSDLFGCGYCLSVWVAVIFAWALPGQIASVWILSTILKTFALHGLANAIHELLKRWFDKIPWVLAFQRTEDANGRATEAPDQAQDADGDPSDTQGVHAGEADDGAQDPRGGDEEGAGDPDEDQSGGR